MPDDTPNPNAVIEDSGPPTITDAELAAAAERIRGHDRTMRAGAVAYLHIGAEFARMKRGTDHGRFIPWCKQFESLNMSVRTIERMIAAADAFGDKIDIVSNLDITKTTVYALTKDSTPEAIRRDFLARIEVGGDKHMIGAAVNEAMAAIRAADDRRKQEARRAKMAPEARAQAEKRDQAAQKRREREEAGRQAEEADRDAAQTEALTILLGCLGDEAERFADLAERSGFRLSYTAELVRNAGTAIPDPDSPDANPGEEAPAEPSPPNSDDVFSYLFGDDPAPAEAPGGINLTTFAKVRDLHDRTDSPGEKAAAAGRMQALASAAGLTVERAVAMVDTPPAVRPGSLLQELLKDPEIRAQYAESEWRRAERRAAILAEFGTAEAVFQDTPIEAALRRACAAHLGPDGDWESYSLGGWTVGKGADPVVTDVRRVVSEAWPLPETVREAWAEYQDTDKTISNRSGIDQGYLPPGYVEARQTILEEMLNTLPAHSLGDIRARIIWMQYWSVHECIPNRDEDRLRLSTLSDDFDRLAEMIRTMKGGTNGGDGLEGDPSMPDHEEQAAEPDPFSPDCWPEPQDDDDSKEGDHEDVDGFVMQAPGVPRMNRHQRRRAEKLKRAGTVH